MRHLTLSNHSTNVRNTTNIEVMPHDVADSSRLYRELMDKARKELIETVRVDSNILKGQITTFRHCDVILHNKFAHYKIELNGKVITGKVQMEDEQNFTHVFEQMVKHAISVGMETVKLEDPHFYGSRT